MRQLKKIIIFSSIMILVYMFISNTNAVKDRPVQTTGVANIGQRFLEKTYLFSKFSDNRKAQYIQYLVEKRFAELQHVLDNDQGDLIEETTSRYSTYAGYLVQFIMKNNLVDQKIKVLKMFDSHIEVLEKYLLQQNYNSGFWLLIQHDINYLKIYSAQLLELK